MKRETRRYRRKYRLLTDAQKFSCWRKAYLFARIRLELNNKTEVA